MGDRELPVKQKTRFVAPTGVATIQPRIIGHGPVRMWADDASVTLAGSVRDLQDPDLPKSLDVESAPLRATLHVPELLLEVTDRRIGHTWRQAAGTTLDPLSHRVEKPNPGTDTGGDPREAAER